MVKRKAMKRKAADDDSPQKAGKGKKNLKKERLGKDADDDEGTSAAVHKSVESDLADARAAADEAMAPPSADSQTADSGSKEEVPVDVGATVGEGKVNTDPYLMADAKYIKKDTRWRNKQRTLAFCSRGVTSQFRHLLDDIKKILPHHKTEPKFEKRTKLAEINQVCELKSCNNALFFEARKKKDLYMYLARVPSGPTIKFQVLNIHTTGEVRLAGNCLLGSRPILHFDKHFDDISYLKLIKQMFIQTLGTPRNHPKSKPFHDHIVCFYWLDKKIWFRHYQISPETPESVDDPEKQILTEIGPRFVLDPIRITSGSFGGPVMFANAFYMSPTALRVQAKKLMRSPYKRRLEMKEDRRQRMKEANFPKDPLDEVFE